MFRLCNKISVKALFISRIVTIVISIRRPTEGKDAFVQGVEYPACPECGIQMQMIFQLDSNHHLPYMFGDSGIGHLHQCRLHKSILAFGWASY